MLIRRINGLVDSNCFVICIPGENGNKGIVIDPGAPVNQIEKVIKEEKMQISYIILTHTHYDHVFYVDALRNLTNAKVVIHEAERGYLSNSHLNVSELFGTDASFDEADIFVKDGDVLNINNVNIEIMHTPGHTPGSMCIKIENNLFSGDTLFKMSVGRTDLSGGDGLQLQESLDKLMKLDTDINVFPGHGPYTTIGIERETNPFT